MDDDLRRMTQRMCEICHMQKLQRCHWWCSEILEYYTILYISGILTLLEWSVQFRTKRNTVEFCLQMLTVQNLAWKALNIVKFCLSR